jgi:two-component system OmpR family sensor kinase
MDGFKARLTDSLQLRLSFWLFLAILGTALIAGGFSFVVAFREAHEFQDEILHQMAVLVNEQHMNIATDSVIPSSNKERETHVFIQRLNRVSSDIRHEGNSLILPTSLHDGFQTIDSAYGSFRVFVKALDSGERVAFAQETEARDEIARHSAIGTLMPFLLLMPLLLLMAANLIRKMFRPITVLSANIDRRSENELHPLDSYAVPSEIRPFIVALNRLLGRVAQSMQAQQRFVADAAHELRTPLTALSLQAERLGQAEMSDMARERLATLRQGIERGRALIDQLLTLARAQFSEPSGAQLVSVHQVFRHVLEDLMPLADAKHLNIGVTSEHDVSLYTSEADLTTLVKNLVDNAVRYTPDGGQVDLSVHTTGARAVIAVVDSGPGIPRSEFRRVFDPFYRVAGNSLTGSGLGLSIVDTIAKRIEAEVTLAYANERMQSGLCAQVLFPLESADATASSQPLV